MGLRVKIRVTVELSGWGRVYADEEELLIIRRLHQVNPGNASQVTGQLLDDECPEDFIKCLISLVRSLLPVEPFVDECEKRNHLRLLYQFLEHLVDVHVHNALGKILPLCALVASQRDPTK